MRRGLSVVRRFRCGSRALIVLKDSGNLPEKSLLFLGILRIIRIFLNRRFTLSLRGQGFVPPGKKCGKKFFSSRFVCRRSRAPPSPPQKRKHNRRGRLASPGGS